MPCYLSRCNRHRRIRRAQDKMTRTAFFAYSFLSEFFCSFLGHSRGKNVSKEWLWTLLHHSNALSVLKIACIFDSCSARGLRERLIRLIMRHINTQHLRGLIATSATPLVRAHITPIGLIGMSSAINHNYVHQCVRLIANQSCKHSLHMNQMAKFNSVISKKKNAIGLIKFQKKISDQKHHLRTFFS